MKRNSKISSAVAAGAFALLGAADAYAQNKYSLLTPSGIAFSDVRGYEDWAVVSCARMDERALK